MSFSLRWFIFHLLFFLRLSSAVDVITLQATNFEMAVSSYRYAAIFFYDSSTSDVLEQWNLAAGLLGDIDRNDLVGDSEMSDNENSSNDFMLAVMDASDADMEDIRQAYALVTPSIKVFRRGVISDWRGPFDAKGIAKHIQKDKLASVKVLSTLKDTKRIFKERTRPIVIGFFPLGTTEVESSDVYSLSVWDQFQSSADSLRFHADFYAIEKESIIAEFNIESELLPAIYLLHGDKSDFKEYTGEILQQKLAEWVLASSGLVKRFYSFLLSITSNLFFFQGHRWPSYHSPLLREKYLRRNSFLPGN
jgi:hypothetical protein